MAVTLSLAVFKLYQSSARAVPMGTRVPAGTHRNFENLGSAGYWEDLRNWVPLGTGKIFTDAGL